MTVDVFGSVKEKYKRLTPKSRQLYERAVKVYLDLGCSRGVFSCDPYPLYIKRAKGSKIYDLDGNEYVDLCFNFTSLILGHGHPAVTEAVRELIGDGPPSSGPTETEVALAEEIVNRIPCAEIVRFAPSGTEAGMNVIRLARAYKGKKKIAKFEGAYHGTYDSVYVSVKPSLELSKDPVHPLSMADSEGITEEVVENVITLPYNNASAVEEAVKKNKDDLAAVIIEPVMPRGGAGGGLILPRDDFLKSVREITEDHDVLLIFDEVITGFRIARGGAQEYFNVKPDLAMLGKVIGGGYPIGAVVGGEEIMKLASGASHTRGGKARVAISGTFSAHPISVAAGLATLGELTTHAYERLNRTGESLTKGLTKILNELGIKGQAVGLGSLFNIFFTQKEIIDYRSTLTADPRLFQYFTIGLISRGIYWSPHHFSTTSAVTTDEDVEQTITAAEETLIALKPYVREISTEL